MNTYGRRELVSRIIPNFANIQNLLSHELKEDNPDLMQPVKSTLMLADLGRITGLGNVSPVSVTQTFRIELQWLRLSLDSYFHQPLPNPEAIINQGLAQISAWNDQGAQVSFLESAVNFYLAQENGMPNAQKFTQQALELSAGNIECQSSSTFHLALIHRRLGDYIVAYGMQGNHKNWPN
ncbi:hypothetical protein B0H16DRAFT_1450041 [Mycena metata]|uniref:Uncharacterized protein n=1 Tax=Mycena metata TaxID=1033252 RepID=A0AAD7K025_9AGAR|nr:hypothetical protein B0H16DRAFT_1450041 [Mycena metata]